MVTGVSDQPLAETKLVECDQFPSSIFIHVSEEIIEAADRFRGKADKCPLAMAARLALSSMGTDIEVRVREFDYEHIEIEVWPAGCSCGYYQINDIAHVVRDWDDGKPMQSFKATAHFVTL